MDTRTALREARDELIRATTLLNRADQLQGSFASFLATEGRVHVLADRLNHDSGVIIYDRSFSIIYVNQWVVDKNRARIAAALDLPPSELSSDHMLGRKCFTCFGYERPCDDCPVMKALEEPSVFFGEINNSEGFHQNICAVSLVNSHGPAEVVGAVEFVKPLGAYRGPDRRHQ